MFKTEILSDPTKPASDVGNSLTFTVTKVPAASISAAPSYGIGVDINDEDGSSIYFKIESFDAMALAQEITQQEAKNQNDQIKNLTQALNFKTAQLSCAKGLVGALRITRNGDSAIRSTPGFGIFTLEYIDDQAEQDVIHTVADIECYVPFAEEEQYDWLRALVGGIHQYTQSIKIELVDFSFEEVSQQFTESLRNRTNEFVNG